MMRPQRSCFWAAVLLATLPELASGFSPARARRHDVFSPNGAFVLDVNPDSGIHTVYETKDRSKPLWSFATPVFFVTDLYLADDGNVVADPGWPFVQESSLGNNTCLTFWSKQGVLKSYNFAEICPEPATTRSVGPGPVGDFWRTWFTKVANDGQTLTIRTTDRYTYTFSMTDGAIVDRSSVHAGWISALIIINVAVICFGAWYRWFQPRPADRAQ